MMWQMALHAKYSDKMYIQAIFDAMSSVGALYLEDEELSQACYESAQRQLQLQPCVLVKSFFTKTILVFLESISG